jgi:hypothetical protein
LAAGLRGRGAVSTAVEELRLMALSRYQPAADRNSGSARGRGVKKSEHRGDRLTGDGRAIWAAEKSGRSD